MAPVTYFLARKGAAGDEKKQERNRRPQLAASFRAVKKEPPDR